MKIRAKERTNSSCGVCGVKNLIALLYPDAVAAFQGCCQAHDKAYRKIDWSVGSQEVDWQFLCCMSRVALAADNPELMKAASTFYNVARKWGKARYALAKVGIVWSTDA